MKVCPKRNQTFSNSNLMLYLQLKETHFLQNSLFQCLYIALSSLFPVLEYDLRNNLFISHFLLSLLSSDIENFLGWFLVLVNKKRKEKKQHSQQGKI